MFLRETEREGGRHGERELGREGCREGGSSGGTGGGGRENRRRRLRPPRYRRKKESMVTNARTCALEMMDIDFRIWESENAYRQMRARAHTHARTHTNTKHKRKRWSTHTHRYMDKDAWHNRSRRCNAARHDSSNGNQRLFHAREARYEFECALRRLLRRHVRMFYVGRGSWKVSSFIPARCMPLYWRFMPMLRASHATTTFQQVNTVHHVGRVRKRERVELIAREKVWS